MIELLGVGVAGKHGGWLLRRICVSIEIPSLIVVMSSAPAERRALLDVIGARLIPDEGRAWLDHVPLMRDTRNRLRARAVALEAATWRGGPRSAAPDRLRDRRGVEATVRHVLIHELDASLDDLAESARALRTLVDAERLSVFVSVARSSPWLAVADRLLMVAAGQLVFDGLPSRLSERLLVFHA